MNRLQSGFSLLEVMVAFSIASVLVVLTLQSIASGLVNQNTSTNYVKAVEAAESILALTEQESLRAGVEKGQLDSNFHWSRETRPYDIPEIISEQYNEVKLIPYKVTVTINWQESRKKRSFSLTALRIHNPDADEV